MILSGVLDLVSGGFVSVRSTGRWDLSDATGIACLIDSGGRRVKLSLRDGSCRASGEQFQATVGDGPGDDWADLPFEAFARVVRGAAVAGAPLDTAQIVSVGLVIAHADPAPFRVSFGDVVAD